MNIAICDDKYEVCRDLSRYIKENFECNVKSCTTAKELVDIVSKAKGDIQALILDIVLSEKENGIEVAAKIHREYPDIKIIFITGYEDDYYKHIFSSFQPYGFISKPIPYNILNFFLQKIKLEENRCLNFISQYKERCVSFGEIIYIQSRKRVCEIVTKSEVYKAYLKISDLEKQLGENFTRCHQSFIVNLDFVDKKEKSQLILKNSDIIPISRKYSSLQFL